MPCHPAVVAEYVDRTRNEHDDRSDRDEGRPGAGGRTHDVLRQDVCGGPGANRTRI